jgi:isocitrate dehydrogenase kinase/phosphatase
VLSSPFFRNQTAYIVGRVVNGNHTYPFVVPVKHDADGKLHFDALLMGDTELAILFSANRAYFLVDMEVPSAYIGFLHAILADKTAAELYTMVGLQKAGKNLFFRDFLHHLRHSRDKFIIAPGIKGLVMSVFTLPSYPYVFKVIRDRISASKDTDRQRVKDKYMLVKHHDRVGRMTDILEYSDVAFPRERFSEELIAELLHVAPSVIEFDGDYVVIRHLYIERRMIPLNLYLERADDAERAHAIREYGNALKELAAVNIFAGDLLFKNFGLTRFNRVVFYDYDEIDYLTDCVFRRIPPPPPGWDEMSGDVWYPVGPKDMFPEEFATFLLTDPRTRECFLRLHAELLDASWWQGMQQEIRSGRQVEVLSYPDAVRFRSRHGAESSRPALR